MTRSESKLAEKNPMWKGKNAGLDAIHIWVSKRKKKPNFCEECKKQEPKDLANISQKYKRNINDYEWLCRKCHMKKDGRLEKLVSFIHPKKLPIKCKSCKNIKKQKAYNFCGQCYEKLRYYWKRRTEQTKGKLKTMSFDEAKQILLKKKKELIFKKQLKFF